MNHPVYRVERFEIIAAYTLRIGFDDGSQQVVDFRPILHGELYGPLQDSHLFNQVRIDPEAHTLAWPNGADFDPETLHDWPDHLQVLTECARRWSDAGQRQTAAQIPRS